MMKFQIMELEKYIKSEPFNVGEVTTLKFKIEGQDLQQLKKGTSDA